MRVILLLAGLVVAVTPAKALHLVNDSRQARGIGTADFWIVALGDSFASGEGNPNVIGAPINDWKWLDNEFCNRSKHAWPYRIAEEITLRASPRTVHLSFLACTGARLENGLLNPYTSAPVGFAAITREPQLDRLEAQILAAGRAPDVLLLSGGGNDIGFGDLVMECLGLYPSKKVCPGGDATAELDGRMARLQGADGLYAKVAQRIASMGIVANRVFLLGCPNPLEGRKRAVTGWSELKIRSACVTPGTWGGKRPWTWVSTNVVKPFQVVQRTAASEQGWQLIDGHISEFERHSYCPRDSLTGGDSWWVGILPMLVRQWGLTGAFHPNMRGHQAIAEAGVDPVGQLIGARDDQCRDDRDCGSDHYCDKGWLTVGKNQCIALKASGDDCSRDDQCRSPAICKGKPAGRCIVEGSVGFGGRCIKDAECESGSCSKDGHCQCKTSSDCSRGKYCNTGTVGIGKNQCKPHKQKGDACSANKQCGSGLDCKGLVGFKRCK